MYSAHTVLALGGQQNPLRLRLGADTPAVLDGLWDGLTWTPLAVYDFFSDNDIELVDHTPTDAYILGFIIGMPLFFLALGWFLDFLFD